MSEKKTLPSEAKAELESWWYTGWQEHVNITADDEEGFLRITPKCGTIYGLAELGKWCDFHDYSMWADFDHMSQSVELVISI